MRVQFSPHAPPMANIVITGFKSETAARSFIHWFNEQGQDGMIEWFENDDIQIQEVDKLTFPIKSHEGNFLIVMTQ